MTMTVLSCGPGNHIKANPVCTWCEVNVNDEQAILKSGLPPIERMKAMLHNHRIKHGCDYAITHKYDETRILTQELWVDAIKEMANICGVTITSIHTYGKGAT